MLVRIVSRNYEFTASGPMGDVTVYDHAGQRLARGLYSAAAAEAWCEAHTERLPARDPRPRATPPPSRRNRLTGY